MNKNLLIAVVVVLVGVGGYMAMQNQAKPGMENAPITEMMPIQGATGVMETVVEKTEVKTFAVEGGMLYFLPKEMKVKKGDTVSVTFTNKEGMHDWRIDEFNVKTQVIKAGESETVTFVADKVGTFEYYCSVGSHRANGMVGTFIVEE